MITGDNALFLLLQAFSSGVAGYITNKYAVNMIFKEYTPLKIGGAVKKNKEKFIEEISDLVERDIINSKTIKDKVLGADFKNSMKVLSRDFLQKSLYEAFENKKLGEIPGWSQTLIEGEQFLSESLDEILSKLLNNVYEHIKIDDLLSNKQVSSIVDYIYNETIKNINSNEKLTSLLSDLYEEDKDVCLNQLINNETEEKINKIISCEIINSIDKLINSKEKSKAIIDECLSIIDTKSILNNLRKILDSKTIDDILTKEEIDNLSLIIYKNLDELMKSNSGREKLENIVKEVFVSAREIDLTLFEVLPIHFGRVSCEYIVDLIKKVIPYLLSWIKDNKEKIESIIDESILEGVENIEDDLRKSMILKVKDSMLVDFSSKNQVVDKLVNFMEEYKISEEASYELYSKIIKLLEETKIKDLIILLEKYSLINEEKIVNLVLAKWEDNGEELSKIFLKRESSKLLNKLTEQDLDELFDKNVKPKIYNLLINNKSRIISYLDKTIYNLVYKKMETVLNSKINDLIEDKKIHKFSKILPDKIAKILSNNSISYKKNISEIVSNSIKDIKLKEVFENNQEIIVSSINSETMNFVKETINKYKSYEIKKVIDKINSNNNLTKEINNKLYDGVKNNLPSIVDGRVKKLIYDNLIKLDEDEICNIAQSFMGKQLKPLSMFGAFLGTIVGLIFGITMQNVNGSYGFYNSGISTLIACVLMGIVGVMTNVIALWMIFCPYEQNKFIAKIPIFRIFSIGYIPSHKNSFASGMAHFIDEELLSGDRVINSFNLQKLNIKNHILSNMKNSNFMVMSDFIRNKKNNISKTIYSTILKLVKKHNNKMSNNLNNKILRVKGHEIIASEFISNKVETSLNNINKLENKIIVFLENKLKNNKSLEEILPENIINTINNKIEVEINDYISNELKSSQVEEVIRNIVIKNENIYNDFMDKSLKEIVNEKTHLNIGENLKTDKFMNVVLLQLKEQLNNYLQNYLKEEFNEEKRFDELFNGKIKNKLDKNIYNLADIASEKLIEYAKENNDKISSMIIKIVRQNLNFFVRMAYDLANGDGLVKDIVNIVVKDKIEDIIREDKDKLSALLYDCLEKEIYPTQIKELEIKATDIDRNLLLDRLIFALKQNENFKNNLNNAYDLIINNIFEIKVNEIAKAMEVTNINCIYDKYNLIINSVISDVITNLNNNKEDMNKFINSLVEDKIMKNLYSINLEEIYSKFNKEDITYIVENLLNLISNSEVIREYLLKLSDDIYKTSIENIELNSIVDKDILLKDTQYILTSLSENKDFNEKNEKIIDEIMDKLFEDKSKLLSEESKSYIAEKIIDSALNTLEMNIIQILKSLNLQSITLDEVDKMHPSEIHELFKSFAGDFFLRLYIYGGFGLVFGINVYLSIVLFIIDSIYSKKIDSKADKSQYKLFKE
ncbi:DUF445 family protein [Terrisporobacter sp.]